jgi:hypothetical protein
MFDVDDFEHYVTVQGVSRAPSGQLLRYDHGEEPGSPRSNVDEISAPYKNLGQRLHKAGVQVVARLTHLATL